MTNCIFAILNKTLMKIKKYRKIKNNTIVVEIS